MTRESMIEAVSRMLARADMRRIGIVYRFVLHLVK